MVTINGIQLKNVKRQNDGGFSASIYMDGKRIGESINGTGICFDIKAEHKQEFESRVINLETFVTKYFDYLSLEQKYKEAVKKYSKQTIVIIAAFKKDIFAGRTYTSLEKCIPEITGIEKSKKCQVKIFRNLNDFNF